MLGTLLLTCERALQAFRTVDNPVDNDFVVELERITERTRAELKALNPVRTQHEDGTGVD